MTIGREIEVTIWPECREHLVARGVDRLSEVLYAARLVVVEKATTPDVKSSHTAMHVADEIEPFTVGRDRRMSKTREGVF